MTESPDATAPVLAPRVRFRRNLIRVMSVQIVTLILLWLLQVTFTR